MSTRNTGRTKKYGVCLNDKCEKYKVPQEILHGNFECPECKKKLSPCAPPKEKSNKLPTIIGGIAVAIAIIAGGIFAFSGGSNENVESVMTDSLETADTVKAMPIKTDTLLVRDTLVVRDTIVQKVAVQEKKNVNTQPKTSSSANGTLNLGYGKYSGTIKGGKPHGQGRLTYSTSHQISRKDAKQRVADAGDYVIGEFYEGELVQGVWYGADNQVKGSVIIGR